MRLTIKSFLVFACMLIPAIFQAQEHNHAHFKNEIGLSGGAMYAFGHKEWGTGIHAHYFRLLGIHSKWALGTELESVWTDGNHFTVGAGAKYEIIDRMSIALIPGISFFKHDAHTRHNDGNYKSRFSLHAEAIYDLFYWKNFHLGTAVDYAWTKGDAHCAVGVHAAYCF